MIGSLKNIASPNQLVRSLSPIISQNISPLRRFSTEPQDLIVVGGGPGGYVAAIKAAQLGLKVTCVERRGTLGGTCLNVGCIPSKALLNSSHKYEEAQHVFPKFGINVKELSFDLQKIMKQKETAVSGLTAGIEMLFKKNKVEYVKGHGKLVGPNEVEVDLLNGGGKKTLKAKNILLAPGSEVTPVPGIPIDEKRIVSSTGALSLPEVPKRLVVIGGGVIGLELGSVWARLGSEVTVIEFTDRIAAGADGEVAKDFKKILEKKNMSFKLKHKVTSAKVLGEKGPVQLTVEPSEGGESFVVEADYVLASIGRRPYLENLGLKEAGVQLNKRGQIEVNDHFVTSVPSVRAIGDCIRGAMLAHKAEEEGIACVENIVNPSAGHVNYAAIPSVIYTHPEVAWVGETEEELKAKNIKYKTGKFPFKANSRARTNDDADGFVKVLADAETDQIYGVHIICGAAGEMIAEGVLAMEYGASSEDIARTSHAHPTMMEAVKEAAMAVTGKAIHF